MWKPFMMLDINLIIGYFQVHLFGDKWLDQHCCEGIWMKCSYWKHEFISRWDFRLTLRVLTIFPDVIGHRIKLSS